MGTSVSVPEPPSPRSQKQLLGHDCSLRAIAEYIKAGKATRIVVMCGAGISVSAGIPDFRTPGTGLYSNLQKYKLPRPEAIFDLDYFHKDPMPFYDLARSLYPDNFRPTPGHMFIRLLQDKGLLLRCFTQNIDTLERAAGVKAENLVEAHGSFASAHCVQCQAEYDQEYVRQQIHTTTSCRCTACDGFVKPDIVFFGENLPLDFFQKREVDLPSADLLLVLGTSLKVQPFADTMHMVSGSAPRLLLNYERVGEADSHSDVGFKFDRRDNYRDVELLASIDDGVRLLCDLLGWREELEALVRELGAQDVDPAVHPIPVDDPRVTRNYRKQLPNLLPIVPRSLRDTVQSQDELICVAEDDEFISLNSTSFKIVLPSSPPAALSSPRLALYRHADEGDETPLRTAKLNPAAPGTLHSTWFDLPQYDPSDGAENTYELQLEDKGEVVARFGPLVVIEGELPDALMLPAGPSPMSAPPSAAEAAGEPQRTIPFLSQLSHHTGLSDGQLSVFQDTDERLHLHRWDASEQRWHLVGVVHTPQKLEELDGVQYDKVIDIEVDSASMGFLQLRLGFNLDDDADEVAQKCCNAHSLPDEYRPQIADYIRMISQM